MKRQNHSRIAARESGMSLLVLIGVLAIVAIFAVVLFREWLRERDHEVSREETATLRQFADAYQRSILRTGTISNRVDWDDAVATELGRNLSQVYLNSRRKPRMLLINTNGWLQPGLLPYVQTAAGSTNRPANARMMILSSLGDTPVPPEFIANGYPIPTEFDNLWNCREGEVPATWGSWGGRADDIKVERINLDPLFLELRIVTGKREPDLGRYAIGAETNMWEAAREQAVNPPRYVLRGTPIFLYTSSGALDAHRMITKDTYYKYEGGRWKSNAVGADMPGGLDLAGVAAGFLRAIPNTNAMNGVAQQELVMRSFITFMRGYMTWAQSGFPEEGKAGAKALQDQMMNTCAGLYTIIGGKDCVPINNTPCD